MISDVPEKIKIRKQKQKHCCDCHSHKLPKLLDGDAIGIQLPREKEWSLGRVIGEEGTRSYLDEVNRKHYRQNHKWLRSTLEELPESVETNLDMTDPTELVESSPAELPQTTIPSSPVVSGPHTEGRPVRVLKQDTDSALCLVSFFYFGFIMYSGAEVLNVRAFSKADLNIVISFFSLLSSTFCLHVLNY